MSYKNIELEFIEPEGRIFDLKPLIEDNQCEYVVPIIHHGLKVRIINPKQLLLALVTSSVHTRCKKVLYSLAFRNGAFANQYMSNGWHSLTQAMITTSGNPDLRKYVYYMYMIFGCNLKYSAFSGMKGKLGDYLSSQGINYPPIQSVNEVQFRNDLAILCERGDLMIRGVSQPRDIVRKQVAYFINPRHIDVKLRDNWTLVSIEACVKYCNSYAFHNIANQENSGYIIINEILLKMLTIDDSHRWIFKSYHSMLVKAEKLGNKLDVWQLKLLTDSASKLIPTCTKVFKEMAIDMTTLLLKLNNEELKIIANLCESVSSTCKSDEIGYEEDGKTVCVKKDKLNEVLSSGKKLPPGFIRKAKNVQLTEYKGSDPYIEEVELRSEFNIPQKIDKVKYSTIFNSIFIPYLQLDFSKLDDNHARKTIAIIIDWVNIHDKNKLVEIKNKLAV